MRNLAASLPLLTRSEAPRGLLHYSAGLARGMSLAIHLRSSSAWMEKTMSRSAPGPDRRPYRWVSLVLVCVLALTIGGHLSPIIAGPLDALVVGMPPQAGDTNPTGPFDLHGLDGLLHVTAVVESPFNGTELVPRGSDQRGGEFLAGGLGDGALDTLDPISEAFPAELTDDTGNPIVTEGLWALRLTRRRQRSRPSHRRPYRSRSRSGTLQRH